MSDVSQCLVAWLLSKNKRKEKFQGMDYRNTAGIYAGIRETSNQVLFSEDLEKFKVKSVHEK